MAGFGLVLVGLAGLLGAGAGSIFGLQTGAAPGGPLSSPQEQLFVAAAILVSLGAGPAIAGMRALMATIAPPGRVSACFGLYAFVGKATNFLGPLLVGLVISATGSLRLGLCVALAFLLFGIACFARMPAAPARLAA
jgi:UMF1 family MFS transporter